jgi:hypothetical protein
LARQHVQGHARCADTTDAACGVSAAEADARKGTTLETLRRRGTMQDLGRMDLRW